MLDGEDELLDFAMERTQLSRNELLAAAAFGGVLVLGNDSEGSDSARKKEYNEKLALAEETLEAKKAEEAVQQALARHREQSGHQFAFFSLRSGWCGAASGRAGVVPRCYRGNPVHRIVRGGWIQAGDVGGNGRGDGPCRSLYGIAFADESFAISHNAAGILVRK
ncbi:hypothetical protein ON010_g7974 [Phytophthora cinnamomi]|nr:hypothetical protein ON010_g7974 [Phytophthora cinnamomi]